jgi:alkanesulfonate monooxygenase SsuD/methylene tetrahydromethanopterin reductase-like flavin-dependent oxidoreductase (luciferase family)
MAVQFGWRVPDFPVDGANAEQFRAQIFDFMDVIHGHFNAAWVGDHFFPWMDTVDQRGSTIESLSTLTYLMARYPKMRGGTIVLATGYRPPALLAKMAANLQWISGGRFILGIGAGWKENEYRAYGYDYPRDRVRLAQLEEAVQVIRAMWTQDEPRFSGQHYQIEDAYTFPRPDPQPPLLIGGAGRKVTLRIVAQYADWLNFNNCGQAEYASLLETFFEHCRAVGRDPGEVFQTYSADGVSIAPTAEQALAMEQASPFGRAGEISGTPAQVIEQIAGFERLGAGHIILRFTDFPRTEGVELFIREVLPRFEGD